MERVLKGRKSRYPVLEKNLGHFFYNRCTKYRTRICQIDGTDNTSETYGSVRSRSIAMAIELQRRGIKSEDVVAICSENTLDNVIPLIGALFLGTKVANLSPTLSVRHIRHLLALVAPKIIFVQSSHLRLIQEALTDTDLQTEIIILEHLPLNNAENEDFRPSDVDGNNGALLFFTSGTTGPAKAICHSHKSCLELVAQAWYYALVGWCNDVLHLTTFYWITSMMILLGTANTGTYRVFCRGATGEDIFKIIEAYEVKSVFMIPVLSYNLTRVGGFEKYDRSSMRVVTLGGCAIAPSQMEKLRGIFPDAQVLLMYGMSEIGCLTAFDPVEDKEIARRKINTSGLPVSNVTLKVVDLFTGELLPPYQKGEICATAPSLMLGYYKATSSHIFDSENFLKTGDMGYYDEDRCIYVLERLTEMFKYQSWHIIPSTIEGALLENESIQAAAVFGIPHPEFGDVPAACIVLNNNCLLGEEEVHAFLKERVPDRERLRGGVTFMEALPRTPTGKVVRRDVRDAVMSLRNKVAL